MQHVKFQLISLFVLFSILYLDPAYNLLYSQDYTFTAKSNLGEYITDYLQRKIIVRSSGASSERNNSLAEKKLWALTEARKNCITQAAIAAGEVFAEGRTLLEAGRIKNHNFELRIQNYVRGIRNISEEYEIMKDGSVFATVTMTLYFDGNKGLNTLLYNEIFDGERKELPQPYEQDSRATQNAVTGIVFDTRDCSVQPSLSPKVYDETGRLIYGPDHVSRKYAFRIGVVGYTKDLRNVADRIGKNPTKIEIIDKIESDPSSVLISRESADRLLNLEKKYGILTQCKVAFWVK